MQMKLYAALETEFFPKKIKIIFLGQLSLFWGSRSEIRKSVIFEVFCTSKGLLKGFWKYGDGTKLF